jgi:hypothetical protein
MTLCDGVSVGTYGYAFVRQESEQNSSLQLLQGASIEPYDSIHWVAARTIFSAHALAM